MIAEWDGVKALIEGADLVGRVRDAVTDEDGEVVRDTYVVLYGAGPSLDDGRDSAFTIPRAESDAEYEFPVRLISPDAEGLRLLGQRIQSLAGKKPVVAGRRADPVTVGFEPAKNDTSVSPPLCFQDVWISFWSRRA